MSEHIVKPAEHLNASRDLDLSKDRLALFLSGTICTGPLQERHKKLQIKVTQPWSVEMLPAERAIKDLETGEERTYQPGPDKINGVPVLYIGTVDEILEQFRQELLEALDKLFDQDPAGSALDIIDYNDAAEKPKKPVTLYPSVNDCFVTREELLRQKEIEHGPKLTN